MDKIIVIGSVNSTKALLNKLIEHSFAIEAVFGYTPQDTTNVSGYVSFESICKDNGIRFVPFVNINDDDNLDIIASIKPDIIFAVGFSQLLKQELLKMPSKGVIGFHPTLLPKGRGRGPIAWLILNEQFGAANFFLMGKDADDGPIFVQQKFKIDALDNASTVQDKIIASINVALDSWLPKLKAGEWSPNEQDHSQATEYARRAPLDGMIDWYESAEEIDRLVRASTRPHPGAFTFYEDLKVIVWQSRIESTLAVTGVVGRVVKINENGELLMQTGNGLLWVTEYEFINYEVVSVEQKVMVGSRFGYYEQNEIFKLRNELKALKDKIDELTASK